MKITKLTVNGQRQKVSDVAEKAHPMLELKDSILVSGAMRGEGKAPELKIADNDFVELVFEDDTRWLGAPDVLEDLYPGSFTKNRSGEATFELPSDLEHPEGSRGIIGKVALKVLNLFSPKLAKKVNIGELAKDLEDKQLGANKGLVRINSSFGLEKFGKDTPVNANTPVLLFLHGTNSSTAGSFGELPGTELWTYIQQAYDKNNILGFQHETMTKSPLQNAVDLFKQLPPNIDLHLISHSRGGLVGEIIARFSDASGVDAGFSQKEVEFFKDEKRNDEIKCIQQLQAEYSLKKFRVKKFIRVACPTGGTTILSKRLDHFFNISLNLIGAATGSIANPVFVAMKSLLVGIIDQKNDPGILPGLEAMKPESPFITVLNNQSSIVSIPEPVVAIAGNCKVKLNLKALVIIASKLFFMEDNDLVVNTKSMYNGSKRKDKLQFFFDEGTDVDHFHYFKNKKTNAAIILALKSTGALSIDGFTEYFRGKVGEAERNAILKLDGGQYSSGNPSGKKPIAVLLPGIMGSNLSKKGDLVWINYLRFLGGELGRLDIGEPGIEAPSIIKTSYKKLGEALQGEYDVVTFAFDWRLPLEDAAGKFDTEIKKLLKLGQPIKVIGHSMGGVLVRDFMVYHPDTWKELNASPGFRLLFLGSPLGGSFRILNVLFGQDDIINKLSKIDIIHGKRKLLNMFDHFPGILCLMPFNTDADNDFSKIAIWKKMADAFGDTTWPLPGESDLAGFKKYRDKVLAELPNIDLSNAVYIAGQDKATPCGYRIDDTIRGPELTLLSTGEGDQSVTWESGIPKGMIAANTVYYVNFTHGGLSNSPAIFNGIKEILVKGQTNLLSRNRPVVRGDQKVFKKPEVSNFDFSPEGIENTLLGISDETSIPSNALPIAVRVSNGDLKYASYPLLAGHLKNDSILYGEKRIDAILKNLLEERHKLGLYPGDIGTYEILLTNASEGFPGAIIVGLGEPDKLTSFELTRTVEQAVSKYLLILNGREKLNMPFTFKEPVGISSLIIACGYGGLSIESSVHSLLQGIINANTKISSVYGENGKTIEVVEFIELYEDRALTCYYSVRRMGKDAGGTLNVTPETDKPNLLPGARKQVNYDQGNDWWNRFTITREDNKKGEVKGMRFSISTGAAREDLRTIFTNTGVVNNLVEAISTDNNWTEEKARAVFELLIPNDFKPRLKRHGNIMWVLDKYTAGYPWELLQDNSAGAKPLCINAGMIRQLFTGDSRINIESVTGDTALVVGDPELKNFLPQLPGALEEAKAVAAILKEHSYTTTELMRESQETIVPALMSSNYKIIHLAGHGVFDPDPEKGSGMVIGKNNYLTTAEIAQMSTTPELVFVNCCFLGKTDGVAEEFFHSRYKLAANIGTQLIENGVKAVVVAGWAVDDAAALTFAKKFYENMFSGFTFGEAVRIARESVYASHRNKNTWGAYQCYGDPNFKFRSTQSWKNEKSYVIAAQAEIDLSNLLSDLNTGETKTETALNKLKMITDEVDKRGIRTPKITETEAMIFKELKSYERAIAKFQELMASGNGSYTFVAVEQFCNLKVKFLTERLENGKLKPSPALIKTVDKDFEKIISMLQSLIQLSPSVERYTLMGSAWKRRITLYKPNRAKALLAIGEASKYYYLAFKEGKHKDVYAYTNWLGLENILAIAGKKDWDQYMSGKNKELPLQKDVLKTLEDMEAEQLKNSSFDYWDRVKIPNLRLCAWMLSATSAKKKQLSSSAAISKSYLDLWKMTGTRDEKVIEIQHIGLLVEALGHIRPRPALLNALTDLKEKLETAIEK